MASKTERTIINAAGLAQGIVLVTFPAASTIFTDTSEYGLSSTPSTGPRSCLRSRWPCHKIAIGLTGDPVPVGSRSGAIMHRNDQRRISAHTCLSSVNCK